MLLKQYTSISKSHRTSAASLEGALLQALLLFARSKVLEKLPAIYEARTDLAALAMGSLCPPASEWPELPSPLVSPISSKMRTARTMGIGPMQVRIAGVMLGLRLCLCVRA